MVIHTAERIRSAVFCKSVWATFLPGQCCKSSFIKRGMMWMCVWKISCPPAGSLFHPIVIPSAFVASFTARESFLSTGPAVERSVSGASKMFLLCSLGTKSVCPRLTGFISRKAMKFSSSYTFSAGIIPAIILQNRQSSIALVYATIPAPCNSLTPTSLRNS